MPTIIKKNKAAMQLLKLSQEQFQKKPKRFVPVLPIEAENLLVDITRFPHAFLVACSCDYMMKAEKAFAVPWLLLQQLGDFSMPTLLRLSEKDWINLFNNHSLHRFPTKQAKVIHRLISKIDADFEGDASKIWSDLPSSAETISRLLAFDNISIKLATMITNILHRRFHVQFSEISSIDVSPDTHLKQVFYKIGLVKKSKKATHGEIIYAARAIWPRYPGILDTTAFEIGRQYCHKKQPPNCEQCPLKDSCMSSSIGKAPSSIGKAP